MFRKRPLLALTYLAVLAVLLASCAPAAPVAKPAPAEPQAQATASLPVAAPTEPATKPAAASATSKPAAEQPKYGGVLNRSIRTDLPDFDLHTMSSSQYLAPISPAYSGLVQYDPFTPGKVIPDLAETWMVSPDGLSYTFPLRKGVKWHDGAPLTTSDLVMSLERLRKNTQAGAGLVPVKAVETPDESTVRLVLTYPSAALINYLALAWSVMMPKHIIDKKGNMKADIVGTGAFKFKRLQRGSFLELERNPDYFVRGRPYLDGLSTYFIPDEATSVAALRTGRVDFMVFLSDASAMRLKDSFKEATVAQFRMGNWRSFYLPIDRAPWSDLRVRRAVHLAVDRQAAIKVVNGGIGELGSMIPEGLGGIPLEELLKRPGYRQPKDDDIAEAKRLLAEAGLPSGFRTSTLYRKGTEYESQAVFTRDQLARIGIDMALRTVDDATFYDLRGKKAYETFTHRRPLAVNEVDEILMKEYKTGGSDNWSNISDPSLDALIDLQSREQDKEKRKALIRQANEKIEELATTIMLCWGGYWRAWGPQVRNYVLGGQLYDDEKFTDVWLAK